MTNERKTEIIGLMKDLLTELEKDVETPVSIEKPEPEPEPARPSKVEMLTIKECADVIQGLSEHTVRHLVKQGKVRSFRTGKGRSGKILVNKEDLIAYFAA